MNIAEIRRGTAVGARSSILHCDGVGDSNFGGEGMAERHGAEVVPGIGGTLRQDQPHGNRGLQGGQHLLFIAAVYCVADCRVSRNG